MRELEVIFHLNALSLLGVALWAYNIPEGILLAAALFSLAIITECWVIMFKEDREGFLERKLTEWIEARKFEKHLQTCTCNCQEEHILLKKNKPKMS